MSKLKNLFDCGFVNSKSKSSSSKAKICCCFQTSKIVLLFVHSFAQSYFKVLTKKPSFKNLKSLLQPTGKKIEKEGGSLAWISDVEETEA